MRENFPTPCLVTDEGKKKEEKRWSGKLVYMIKSMFVIIHSLQPSRRRNC